MSEEFKVGDVVLRTTSRLASKAPTYQPIEPWRIVAVEGPFFKIETLDGVAVDWVGAGSLEPLPFEVAE